jgi:ATPase family associated with various cellular activities (AAA)
MPKKQEGYSLDHIAGVGDSSIYTYGNSLLMPRLLQHLLSNDDLILQEFNVNGTLTKSLPELLALIKDSGGRMLKSYKNEYIFSWKDHSYVSMYYYEKTNNVTITGQFTNDSLLSVSRTLDKEYVSKIKKNLIFSIIRNSYGLAISSMGDGSSPLIKDNYLPEVLEDVDYVISSFTKTPPGGRICILNGEPGTGKTFLIKNILQRMDVVFLIVPSNLIDSLDKPEFMPLLINVKNDHEKAIVMIIEDGDACLVPRNGSNMSTISSLLNLSDGILGSIIDIKMIISTNAEIKEMDEAIMRPGRLCKNIHVGALPYEQANKRYQDLMKDSNVELEYKKFYTLAEVYDLVNRVDSAPTSRHNINVKRQIGFGRIQEEETKKPSRDLTVNKAGFNNK